MLRLLATAALALPGSMLQAQGWVDRTPTNPLQSPSNRVFPAMCWDAANGYVLLYGGFPGFGGAPNETWRWNGTAWTRQLTTGPTYWSSQPSSVAMTFHPPANQVVMVQDGSTFLWTGTDWLLHPAFLGPTGQGAPCHVALAHDPVRNQTVCFLGARFNSGIQAAMQTYVWDGFGWSPRPTAVVPMFYENPTLAWDPAAGRLLLGVNGGGNAAFYEWTGTNWQQRLPAGAPTAAGVLATDTAQQKLVMFDGVMNFQPNHTWTVANGVMQQIATPVEPSRRWAAAMAYDPVRQRLVLFGGSASTINPYAFALGDTWEFQLPPGASFTTYGAGCLGSRGVPTIAPSFGSLPRVGQTFSVAVTNLALQAWTFMFLGTSDTSYGPLTLPLSLGFIGAPGCSLLASGDDLGLVTNVLGTGLWQWPVPNAPGFSFYTQAFSFDAPANPLGITTSNAGHGVIGF